MQRLAFRKFFNQFSHISYLLVISFTTKFELQKSNYFCDFNINASEKKIILSRPLPLSLSLSLSLSLYLSLSFSISLSLHLINYYLIYNGSLFSEGFIFYGLKFIVERKRHEKIEIERADFFQKSMKYHPGVHRVLYSKRTRGSL